MNPSRLSPAASRGLRAGLVFLAVVLAAWQRDRAVRHLPVDFDELSYLPAAYLYVARMDSGPWTDLAEVTYNFEHPPMVKLAYAVVLRAEGTPEPDWKAMKIGSPPPAEARAVFTTGRWTSALPGVGQVAVAALVHPLAGLLLALESYHAKYTAQAYLEAIPGLLLALAILLFEAATRGRDGSPRPDPDPRRAAAAFALLGAAAAGKYPYGGVGVLALFPLAILAFPRRPGVWLALAAASLVAFLALDPWLWRDGFHRAWESVAYHLSYPASENVRRANLPWYMQLVWLFRAAPTRWHPGVFPLGAVTVTILPLAIVGLPIAARRRPAFATSACVGLAFLLAWPVKWPQYLMLVLVPLTVCAAHAPAALARAAERLSARRAAAA